MDLKQIDLSALIPRPGAITTEWQAFQQTHGLARAIVVVGALAALAAQAAQAFHAIPELSADLTTAGGILSSLAGLLSSHTASTNYQENRTQVKTTASNALADAVTATAKVAVAEAENTTPPRPPAPADSLPQGIPTAPAQVPAAGVVAPLLLLGVLFLGGCASQRVTDDVAIDNANAYYALSTLPPAPLVDEVMRVLYADAAALGHPIDTTKAARALPVAPSASVPPATATVPH